MIARFKTFLLRLPLAFLLAVLIIPVGNLLSPDTLFAGRTQVPASVDAAMYAIAFLPILLVFPTKRGQLLAAAALALGIAGFLTLQPGASSMMPFFR